MSTSYHYAEYLEQTLKRKGIPELTPDQLAEAEEIIASAMQDAWERGQEFPKTVGFSNSHMED